MKLIPARFTGPRLHDLAGALHSSICHLKSAMKKQRLLLWDIDGTLISTGAAGQRAIALATAERFGGSGDLEGVEIAGRTDISIAHQILAKYGEPLTEENMKSFLK